MPAQLFSRAAIIGVGLIGGSLGLAVRARRLVGEVVGIDESQDRLEQARRLGAVDAAAGLAEGVRSADLIVLAVPVGRVIEVLRAAAPHLKQGAVVTDVASVKEEIVRRAEEILPAANPFVGGHPMTGSEQKGVENADPYLFENACYVLTSTPRTDRQALLTTEKLVLALGARCVILTPEEHDRAVAGVSHLPHLAAAALANTVAGAVESRLAAALAGGGFRDSTRIAAGDPALWCDILLANREKVAGFLRALRDELIFAEKAISAGDRPSLEAWLERAAGFRRRLPVKVKGHRSQLYYLVLDIPDQPGSIAKVASLLAGAGINIADIEIMRVREGEGGTVNVGFASYGDCKEALEALRAGGVKCRWK